MLFKRKTQSGTIHDRAGRDALGPLVHRRATRVIGGALAALTAMAGVTGVVLHTSAGRADAASQLSWAMTAGNIQQMSQQDPVTTSYFFNTPNSYGTGSSLVRSPVQSGYATTPMLNETSYAQFSSDIQNGITYPYKWVMYDPENWAQTPLNEQQDPIKYMQLFGQLAHAHGLKVTDVPARDLSSASGSLYPRLKGETTDQWFVRVNLAGAAAAYGDTFILQDEANETNISEYDWLFNQVKAEALAANPGIRVFSEVSTSNGTPDQMAAAAQSMSPDGFYVAAPGAIPQATQFFQEMKGAGY
jgi:hypothetical protein